VIEREKINQQICGRPLAPNEMRQPVSTGRSVHFRLFAALLRGAPAAQWRWGSLCCCALAVCLSYSCTSHHVEETVTIDVNRLSALPSRVQTIAVSPDLPARDPDVEKAGDRIAAAITLLNTSKRRGGAPSRTNAALRALDQAEAALGRVLREKKYPDSVHDTLRAVIHDLNATERVIARGAFDEAIKELDAIDKRLDTIAVPTDTPPANDEANKPSS